MSTPVTQTAYAPYDNATQPAMTIAGYRETYVRVPKMPLFKRPLTLSEIAGPTRITEKLHPGQVLGDGNLAQPYPGKPRALGQLIQVSGRLLDEDARPVKNSVIEIWHCNASGRYMHPMDANNPSPLDENFIGSGRVVTDANGRYEFVTVKPAAYPYPNHPEQWWRPAHIHMSVFGNSYMNRLITQMFFPGDPFNEIDLILNSIPDPKGRARMIARQIAMAGMPMPNIIGFEHDIVVRGSQQTPFGV
jgi:protocatechuate 3,4-dioxygenase, beta subunit